MGTTNAALTGLAAGAAGAATSSARTTTEANLPMDGRDTDTTALEDATFVDVLFAIIFRNVFMPIREEAEGLRVYDLSHLMMSQHSLFPLST